MTDAERAALDPGDHEYYLRVKGSQTQLFGWRLGEGVDRMDLKINIGFVFVGVTFFGTFFAILLGCYPVEKHWQIYPDPGNFCQPAVSRLQAWVLICTNLATDFYIMSIPLPMVWSARISLAKKIGLCVMFCGGLVTAIFGGLRCGYVLENSTQGPMLAGEWSCRESFVAVFVSNFPILFPVVHRALRHTNQSSLNPSSGGKMAGSSKDTGRGFKLSNMSKESKKNKFKHPLSLPGETFFDRYGSEEEIIATPDGAVGAGKAEAEGQTQSMSSLKSVPEEDDIEVTREWRVQSEELHPTIVAKEKKQMDMGFHAS